MRFGPTSFVLLSFVLVLIVGIAYGYWWSDSVGGNSDLCGSTARRVLRDAAQHRAVDEQNADESGRCGTSELDAVYGWEQTGIGEDVRLKVHICRLCKKT